MPPTRFAADLAIGIIVAVLFGGCFLCRAVLLAAVGAAMSQAEVGSQARAAFEQISIIRLLLDVFVPLAICFSGIGVAMGTRWGFLLGAIAAFAMVIMWVIQVASGGMEMESMGQQRGMDASEMKSAYNFAIAFVVVLSLLAVAYGTYCVTRLIGKVGPPLR